MTENYEQELELIDGATVGAWKEYEGVIRYEINHLGDFYKYFNPAHMRQRIEREMAKDARIKELEEALQKVLDDSSCGVVPKSHLNKIEELLK